MNAQPQAIIFDLYETLVTEFDPHWIPGPSIGRRLDVSDQSFAQGWSRIYDRRMSGAIPDFPSALREIVQSCGQQPDEAIIQQLHEERLQEKTKPFIQVADNIIEMLQVLRTKSVKIGLLSNAACEEVAAWQHCRLASFFDEVVFSYQVGLIKPDQRIYHLTCERLGVSPTETIFIGDGGSRELTGAREAGLRPYCATWYLNRWPEWKMSAQERDRAAHFPRLEDPGEVINLTVQKLCKV